MGVVVVIKRKKRHEILDDLPEVIISSEKRLDTNSTQEATDKQISSQNEKPKEEIIQEDSSFEQDAFNDDLATSLSVEELEETEINDEEELNNEKTKRVSIWEWADNHDADEEILPVEEVKETQSSSEEKVDLNSFFQASKQKRRLSRNERKQYSKKELKRRKKLEKEGVSDEITTQRTYKFRKKKYKNVEDFIVYLNNHYLDIDDIAVEVLKDERFFGWVGHHSGVFPQSLKQFKEIQNQLKKK